MRALDDEGYSEPTPIQAQAIPHLLDGRDLLGCAQTGTGKTAAFLLPILHELSRAPATGAIRALILAPTRELAAQIAERADAYGRFTQVGRAVLFGGVSQGPQERALARKPEILVATPGRLLDLIGQGHVRLDGVEFFVLDEADRMLDMGFVHDVRRILKLLPRERQTVFFSATMPEAVMDLAHSMLVDPVRVSVTPAATTAETVAQTVRFVARAQKRAELESILRELRPERTLVFSRTKHGANRIAEQLQKSGFSAAAIHGNKSQNARERALSGFKAATVSVLVATDIAARGIDVDGVSLVVNYDLPNEPESYVHRIGRTGRAAATGTAIALCDPLEEADLLRDIERTIRARIPVFGPVPVMPNPAASPAPQPQSRGPRPANQGRRGPSRFGGRRPQ
ncbi:MAG: DEAD/DEAH box helicase [Polyangiaceae bacterium]